MCGMTVMMRFGKVGERTDLGDDSRSLPLLLLALSSWASYECSEPHFSHL